MKNKLAQRKIRKIQNKRRDNAYKYIEHLQMLSGNKRGSTNIRLVVFIASYIILGAVILIVIK